MEATVLSPEPASPPTIHSCPACSHWLPDGTLACPDCQTLTYGHHLGTLAATAQQLEQEQQWAQARDLWRSALQWLPENTRQAASIQQHIAAIDQRLNSEEDRKARWTKRLGPLAPAALFLLKIKSFLFVVLKLKFLLSLAVFFGLYWAIFGWQFALGFTITILIHEMGHFVAAKRRGLKVDLPMFLPGLGAYVRWYGMGVSREDLAGIALAGPFAGLLAALACWGMFWQTHLNIFLVLANVTAWLNLLNMIAVFWLDGAKATFALSRMQRVMVAATCVIFFGLTCARDPMEYNNVSNHYIFLLIAATMGWRCFTNDAPEEPHTPTLVYYVGLFLVLGLVLHMTGITLSQIPEFNSPIRTH
jgi:Zn-dependent protease